MAEFGYRNDVTLTLTPQEQASVGLYDSVLDDGNFEEAGLFEDVHLTGIEACEEGQSETDVSPFECAMTIQTTEDKVIFSCIAGACHRRAFGGEPMEHPTEGAAMDLEERLDSIIVRKQNELEARAQAQARETVESQLAALGIA